MIGYFNELKKRETEVKADRDEVDTRLHVLEGTVDLHEEENSKAHHTDLFRCTKSRVVDKKPLHFPPDVEFESPMTLPAELVVRRGQPFKMSIEFDRPYDIKDNDIKIQFTTGNYLRK